MQPLLTDQGFTSFCEYADTKPRKMPTWFVLNDDRPLAVFASDDVARQTWYEDQSGCGRASIVRLARHEANAGVGAIHPQAMPVIRTTEAEVEEWMAVPAKEALKLQRPLPDGVLKIVATGEKEDQAA